jgi:cytochrome c oxidase subunit I
VVAVAWHPSLKHIEIFATLFHRSLVAHVNLSISVWFLCCVFLCWSTEATRNPFRLHYFEGTSRVLMMLAICLMTGASFDPSAIPLMSNYVPVLEHPLFYLAVGLIVAAIMVQWLAYLPLWTLPADDFLGVANRTTHAMIAVALLAFAASYRGINPALELKGEIFYELLFWGGGHVLQFIWVQVMLVAWALLIAHLNPAFTLHRAYRLIMWTNLLCVLTTPLPYLLYDVTSGDFRLLMTQLMAWVSGLAPVLFMLLYVWEGIRGKYPVLVSYRNPFGASLYWSFILFALGGAFAVMIDGINVKIPAHYHGSLLGVTVALMGLAYLLMHEHGYGQIARSHTARLQPLLLGVGQVLHIVGLFWSGGYGVQRKSPEAASDAMTQADLALRVQSTGGGLAILGGLLFLIVMLREWRTARQAQS